MSTITHRILRAELAEPILTFKELYHDAIHGITYDDINIVDKNLDSFIIKINDNDSIEQKSNDFISLLRMWITKYICNADVLKYIFSKIHLDSLRGIYIYLYVHRNIVF